jgi:peptidoglycan/LPS O-acetylase OafA/YrhL
MDKLSASPSGAMALSSKQISWPNSLLFHFTRITSNTSYIPEIDGLRFLAITGVIFYHLPVALRYAWLPLFAKTWFTAGQLGVQLFFIISGFVLALPFANHAILEARPVRLKKYFFRRVTRLEPPYLIALFLMFQFHNLFAHGSELWGHLLSGILYLHWISYSYANPINPVAWSLEVEVQFYLLVPILTKVFLLPRLRRRIVLVLCVFFSMIVNTIANIAFHGHAGIFEGTLVGFLHFFLIGFLFADFYVCSELPRPTIAWDVLALLSILFVVYGHIYRYTDEVTTTLGLALVFGAAFLGKWSKEILHCPWIAIIGGMCYSIYLIHYFILRTAGVYVAHHPILERGGLIEYALTAVILMPLILCCSSLFFALIERPCMDPTWPRKLMGVLQNFSPVRSGTR